MSPAFHFFFQRLNQTWNGAGAANARHRSASDTFLWLFTDSQLHSNINYLSRQLQRGFGLFSFLALLAHSGRPFYSTQHKARKIHLPSTAKWSLAGSSVQKRLVAHLKEMYQQRHAEDDARLINANSLAVHKLQTDMAAINSSIGRNFSKLVHFPKDLQMRTMLQPTAKNRNACLFKKKIGFIELVARFQMDQMIEKSCWRHWRGRTLSWFDFSIDLPLIGLLGRSHPAMKSTRLRC
jgi:hypothetical protein